MIQVQSRILVVDDEENLTLVLEAMLARAGYDVISTNDSVQACEWVSEEQFDLIITDLSMPKRSGLELLEHCKRVRPTVPVMMITAFGTIETAVKALKLGAFDYVMKPVDQDDLLKRIEHALKSNSDRDGVGEWNHWRIRDPEVVRFESEWKLALQSGDPLMVVGERGSQLESWLMARARESKIAPLVQLSCAAYSDADLEEQLRVHSAGSHRPTRMELARGGVLVLSQAQRLGPQVAEAVMSAARVSSIRIWLVWENPGSRYIYDQLSGSFRVISAPGLSQRMGSLESMLRAHADLGPEKVKQLVEQMASAQGMTYRDLEVWIEKARVPEHQATDGLDFKERVRLQTQRFERDLIVDQLRLHSGNVTQTAKTLGLSRKGLQLKLKELGIQRLTGSDS